MKGGMMKVSMIMFLFLCLINLSAQDVLDIAVKGISDAQNDGAQKDRLEAILDAKRQACEKAGLKINAKTTVENFQTVYDYVETEAEAVLLPGFQIVEVGYMADGTYQVVLSGKVKVVVEEEISMKELRYAKSLNDKGQYSQCEKILRKYIDSNDKDVSEELREEALYYLIKWGYSFNIEGDVQKYASYYPDSKNIKKLEDFTLFSKTPVYSYDKTIETDSTAWIDKKNMFEEIQYNKSISAVLDTISFNDFNGNKHTLLIDYNLYHTGREAEKERCAYGIKMYYIKGDMKNKSINDMKIIEERFKSFSPGGSKTFNHSASGKWFSNFEIKGYNISGKVPTGSEKYSQSIKFKIYQKSF
jgi:hypothetical protein